MLLCIILNLLRSHWLLEGGGGGGGGGAAHSTLPTGLLIVSPDYCFSEITYVGIALGLVVVCCPGKSFFIKLLVGLLFSFKLTKQNRSNRIINSDRRRSGFILVHHFCSDFVSFSSLKTAQANQGFFCQK